MSCTVGVGAAGGYTRDGYEQLSVICVLLM